MICGEGFFTMIDAMIHAEANGGIVYYPACPACGKWHVRPARSKAEAARCARYYRAYVAGVMPGVAKARGWQRHGKGKVAVA